MFINPTGGRIRNDSIGGGFWKASRGSQLHEGVDFLLPDGPGQDVVAPHEGDIIRYSLPYPYPSKYSGIYIKGSRVYSTLWYLETPSIMIGTFVQAGQFIGIAQDISIRYGEDCEPHIHWQIEEIDPTLLL